MSVNISLKSTLNSFNHVYKVSLCIPRTLAVPDIVGLESFLFLYVLVIASFFAASNNILINSSLLSGFLESNPDVD